MRVEAAASHSRCTVAIPLADAPEGRRRHLVHVTDGRPRETGAATYQRDHPIDHHVAETAAVSRIEVRLGARATRTPIPAPLAEES